MSWVYLDDKFHSNQKVLEVGNAGAGLFARALAYCGDHLTDGYVPISWARTAGTPKLRDKLTSIGLWVECKAGDWYEFSVKGEAYKVEISGVGYFIPDYLLLNPSKSKVLEKRNKRAVAGRAGAEKRWQTDSKRDGKTMANGMANAIGAAIDIALQSQCPPTPTPTPSTKTPLTPLAAPAPLDLLLEMFGEEGRMKIRRTVRANGCGDGAIGLALEAAKHPSARDPLAVALKTLKERRAA